MPAATVDIVRDHGLKLLVLARFMARASTTPH
jgi:hypothetical protein